MLNEKIEDFVKRMELSGVLFEVENGFLKAKNTANMSGADMIEMSKLDRKGDLTKYLSER